MKLAGVPPDKRISVEFPLPPILYQEIHAERCPAPLSLGQLGPPWTRCPGEHILSCRYHPKPPKDPASQDPEVDGSKKKVVCPRLPLFQGTISSAICEGVSRNLIGPDFVWPVA
ncbi:U3 small nucleolar RNA-associated protein 15, partial [Fusarium oxysporum f. sp. albedinis]